MKGTFLIGLVAAWGAIGCGGGGPAGDGKTTYTYAVGKAGQVGAGTCAVVAGPIDLNAVATMSYEIDDATATDAFHAAVIADSFYYSEGCGYSYAQTAIDDSFGGTHKGSAIVYPDTYDFIVSCLNLSADCVFTLTWTATY
jgi:hypothetical protein